MLRTAQQLAKRYGGQFGQMAQPLLTGTQSAPAADPTGDITSIVKGAVIGRVVGVAVTISCIVLIGWAIYNFVIKPRLPAKAPKGGTIFDEAIAKAVHRGPMAQAAISLGKPKTCQEEFGNNETDPKKKQFGFWDSKRDGCYSCPAGYRVNVLPSVDDPNKCTQVVDFLQKAKEEKATFHRRGLGPAGLTRPEDMKALSAHANNPNQVIKDLDQYWLCAPNTNRTVSAINTPQACQGACEKMYSATGTLGPAFEDFVSGQCYSCEVGFNRSAAPITAVNACSKPK